MEAEQPHSTAVSRRSNEGPHRLFIPRSPAEGAGIHEAGRWSPPEWWGPWLDDTSSRHLNTQFSDPEGLEFPWPWKEMPPPYLCQAEFQWHWEWGHHQVPGKAQESCWQKAGACVAPAESNSLCVLKTKLPCLHLGMQMGIFLTSFPEVHFMISKVELLHVQVNGIKISALIFVKHLGTVAMNIKGEPRRKITIVCWVRFELCASNSWGYSGNNEKNRTAKHPLILWALLFCALKVWRTCGKIVFRHVHTAQTLNIWIWTGSLIL